VAELKTRDKCIQEAIKELLIDIAKRMEKWSRLTFQTAQPRIGYAGQHLTSLITGYKGSFSGARGVDLIINENNKEEIGEIKSCIRAFQLSKCLECKKSFSNIYLNCPYCGSNNIDLKEDSKWLISVSAKLRNKLNKGKKENKIKTVEEELFKLIKPKYYFLFLVDFEPNEFLYETRRGIKIFKRDLLQIHLYRIEPEKPGFLFCMIDYIYNIIPKQNTFAPFNLWPFQLKFFLMKPKLIFKTIVSYSEEKFLRYIRKKSTENLSSEELHELDRKIQERMKKKKKYLERIDDITNIVKEKKLEFDNIDIEALSYYLPNLENFIEEIIEIFEEMKERNDLRESVKIYLDQYITLLQEFIKLT